MKYSLTVEDICRKLKPVFGKKIDKLYLKYKLSDTKEEKQEMEQALSALYEKYLNTTLLGDKILLEPPAKEVIAGEYQLGKVVYADKELYPFGLREKDWPRHVCISGMSGSGKTTFAFQILGNFILKNKPFWAFDWKKSFRPLMLMSDKIICFTVGNDRISNHLKFNINEPPVGVDPKEWVGVICDLVNESFFASFGVHKLLSETMDEIYKDFGVYKGSGNYPTWHQIKDRLLDKADDPDFRRGRESEWLTSALRIAHSLTFGNFGETVNYKGKGAVNLEEIDDKQVIFEMHTLSSPEKKFFSEFLLTYVYKKKKADDKAVSTNFNQAIVVDEAHNVFLKDKPQFIKESITDMVYREIREYGISLICLDQHVSKISDTVVGNSATQIAFQQMLPSDIETISGVMLLRDRDERKYFTMLPVGCAIVRLSERYFQPFLVNVPNVKIKNRIVSDKYIQDRMNDLFADKVKIMNREIKASESRSTDEVGDPVHRSAMATMDRSVQELRKKASHDRGQDRGQPRKNRQPPLKNHIQRELVETIAEQIAIGTEVEVIRRYLIKAGYKIADINGAFKRIRLPGIKAAPVPKISVGVHALSDLNKRFLMNVYKYPQFGTAQLYKQLKISSRKGNNIRKDLIKKGYVRVVEERNDKGWRKRLELSPLMGKYIQDIMKNEMKL